MKISSILNTNKELIIRNGINRFMEDGISIREYTIKTVKQYSELFNIEKDMDFKLMMSFMDGFVEQLKTKEGLKKFKSSLREHECCKISDRELLKTNLFYCDSWNEIKTLLSKHYN